MELRTAKMNIWKKWRGKKTAKQQEKNQEEDQDKEWLEKIESKLEELKQQTEKRKAAEKTNKERREALIKEKKYKQEELLRQAQEKIQRKKTQQDLQSKWEMMRWVTKYLAENMDRWELERKERDRDMKKKIDDWNRQTRHEKIREIREKTAITNYKPTPALTQH